MRSKLTPTLHSFVRDNRSNLELSSFSVIAHPLFIKFTNYMCAGSMIMNETSQCKYDVFFMNGIHDWRDAVSSRCLDKQSNNLF